MISRFILLVFAVSSLTSQAGTYAQFRTVWGDIDVELYDDDKPITVRNFIRYVQSGRYDNMFFHRCPTNQSTRVSDFVVQGGGFYVMTNGTLDRVPDFGNIPNEFGVGRRFSNTYGTIAMAKVGGDTNSANSQFFFNLNNNSFLDATNDNGFFTVFGRVVGRSTNALNSYRGRRINQGIKDMTAVDPEWGTLPVTYTGTRAPTLNDLEFPNISVLKLSVTATNGIRELSWNSLGGTNHVYHVEFSTSLPPVWQTLVSTNGIGRNQTMRITDSSTGETRRFYRVRIGL